MRRRTQLNDRRIGSALLTLFILTVGVGAGALALWGRADGQRLEPIEAAFTATSALTLTGLTVVGTETLNPAGLWIIATLIALGAVGVTTVTVGVLVMIGRHSWGGEQLLGADLGAASHAQLRRLTLWVTIGTAAATAAGTLALRASGLRWGDAGFYALSGFANAGFATLPGSLSPLGAAGVATVNLLVVVGGLGYVAWFETQQRLRRQVVTLGVTAQIVILGTAVMLAAGAAGYALLEGNNPATLAHLTGRERLLALITLTVMPRSAGFSLTDTGALSEAGKLFTAFLMYIGAGPSSTGGGIKLTGAAVLLLALLAAARGDTSISGRRWRLESDVVVLATAVAVLLAATAGVLAVSLAASGASAGDALLDAVSATTTTGLSTGAVAEAGAASQALTIIAMLAGRLCPTLLLLRLSRRRPAILLPPARRPLIS